MCDLTDALEAALSRVSFHLKILKDACLVTDRTQGRWVYYALNPEALDGPRGTRVRPAPEALRPPADVTPMRLTLF